MNFASEHPLRGYSELAGRVCGIGFIAPWVGGAGGRLEKRDGWGTRPIEVRSLPGPQVRGSGATRHKSILDERPGLNT